MIVGTELSTLSMGHSIVAFEPIEVTDGSITFDMKSRKSTGWFLPRRAVRFKRADGPSTAPSISHFRGSWRTFDAIESSCPSGVENISNYPQDFHGERGGTARFVISMGSGVSHQVITFIMQFLGHYDRTRQRHGLTETSWCLLS